MNQDFQKFIDLLQTDTELQEKMKAASENYTGEQTQEALFQNLVIPAAEEAGFQFTWDDFLEYVEQEKEELRGLELDEMDQVAGGFDGVGVTACIGPGIGLGGSVVDKRVRLAGGCLGVGFGYGANACAGEGVAADPGLVKP